MTAANPGAAGNQIGILFVNPEANNASLSITVANNLIAVSLATGSAGAITSTASQILTALAANTAASALVTAALAAGSSGAGVVTPFTATYLTGGQDAAFPLNTPVLVTSSSNAIALAGTGGTIPQALQDIFDQTGAAVVVVNVAVGSDAGLSEVTGSSTAYTGVWAFLNAQSLTGVRPRILVAPGFSSTLAVAQAMNAVAMRLRAIHITDGPNTTNANAVTYAGNFGSDRQYLVDPQVEISSNGSTINAPASARVAGVIALTDNSLGFWYSPSNKPIQNIVGLARPIGYTAGDYYSGANILNAANVATIINLNGFRLWGNRATSGNFLVSRRIADLIEDSIQAAIIWAVDRPVNKSFLEDVSAYVNQYISTLKQLGAIIDGRCWPDPNLNSPANLQAGNPYFNFDFVGPYPAERITFQVSVNNGYLTEIITSGN